MEKWKRQFIRYLFPYSKSRLAIEQAFVVKHPHVPSALYKYRTFSPQHKDALSNGVLWRCSPDRFNDPYDSVVYFDVDRFFTEDQSAEEFFASMKKMKRNIDAGREWIPVPIKNPIQQREWRLKITTEFLNDQPAGVRNAMLNAFDAWQRTQWENMVRLISKRLRAGLSVLSLCENATSILMWSHYSANHTGFCIEYDLRTLEGGDLRRRLCFPMFYRKKLTDATRYLAKRDFKDFNNLFGTYICLLKSDEWAYEKEWRIACPVGASNATDRVQMPKPKAVILGARVQAGDETWMREFCNNNAIPLKRMVQRHNEFRLEVQDANA